MRRALMGAVAVLGLTAAGSSAAAGFDRSVWLQDYAYLKQQMELRHANLRWFASPEGGIDIPALDRRTLKMLDVAENDKQAEQALRDYVAGFDDGHFSALPSVTAPGAQRQPEPAKPDLKRADAHSGCAALGYASKSAEAFSLPFETLPSFRFVGPQDNFRTGTVRAGGALVGIVRIKNFSQTQFPGTCEAAWKRASPKLDRRGDDFTRLITKVWLSALAAQLRALSAAGAQAVIVDVGTNSGGNDSGDWVPRLFSAKPIPSARVLMTAGPAFTQYLDDELDDLGLAKPRTAADRAALAKARKSIEERRAALAGAQCDMRWVWTEQRPWGSGCARLVDAGWASGPFFPQSAPAGLSPIVAEKLFWPVVTLPYRGSWTRPTYVLVNGATYSSAEMFAASMKDNELATIVGVRTGGDGCGFMSEQDPVVLPHSKLRFRMGNCVRLRRDGRDEVEGISPDIEIGAQEGESARTRASRLLVLIAEDLR